MGCCLFVGSEVDDIKLDPKRELGVPAVTCMTAGSSIIGEAS